MTAEPDALRLVPVEPTREMMDAWHRSAWPKGPDVSLLSQAGLAFCRHYAAMLAAAPVSPDSDLLKEAVGQTRFYIDCEFDGHSGPLLSLALVREDGHSIHIRADVEPMDLWVRKNVLPIMDQHDASESATVYHDRVGDVIRQFIGPCERPVIIADSPVDIGRFCRALSTGSDGQWASTDYPLMAFEVHNVDCYPTTLEGAVQHNAWWDAMALRAFLSKVEERGHD